LPPPLDCRRNLQVSSPPLQALGALEKSPRNLRRQHLRLLTRGLGIFDVNKASTSLTQCFITTAPRMTCSPGTGMCFYSTLSTTSDNLSFVVVRHYCACRPVNEVGERVTPSKLLEHRHSHEFLGPCCLCASLESDGSSYTEASIFVAMSGPTAGEYTAACATGQCRYWGRFHLASSNNLGGLINHSCSFPRASLRSERPLGEILSSSG
jgi:hypothetical protein